MSVIAQLKDLLPRVVEHVAKCPEPVMLRALRDAWRVFCMEADAWREELAGITCSSSVATYALTIPYEADVQRITEVRWRTDADVTAGLPGELLDLKDFEALPVSDGSWNICLVEAGQWRYSSDGSLIVTVSLAPRLDLDTDVPTDVLNLHGDAIAAKAIASLKSAKGKPYYDPDGWLIFTQQYNAAKSRARRAAATNRSGSGNVFG
jgi:hypothetical protein